LARTEERGSAQFNTTERSYLIVDQKPAKPLTHSSDSVHLCRLWGLCEPCRGVLGRTTTHRQTRGANPLAVRSSRAACASSASVLTKGRCFRQRPTSAAPSRMSTGLWAFSRCCRMWESGWCRAAMARGSKEHSTKRQGPRFREVPGWSTVTASADHLITRSSTVRSI